MKKESMITKTLMVLHAKVYYYRKYRKYTRKNGQDNDMKILALRFIIATNSPTKVTTITSVKLRD